MEKSAARVAAAAAPAERAGPRGRGARVLALLALAWLAATLYSAHATIAGSADAVLAMTHAALALPSVMAASLLAGGAAGLVTGELLGRRFGAVATRWPARYGAALAGGLAVGLAGGALVLSGYGTTDAILVLTAALAGASVLGAAVAALRPRPAVTAAFAGLFAWFAVGAVQALFTGRLMDIFGAGATVASRESASWRLSFAVAVLGGVVAGGTAYRYLRRHRAAEPLRWPVYLVAGGGPGLLLLLADLVTLVGGARLLRLVGSVSADDRATVAFLSESRIETGLVVFFVGALTALLAFGRTLRTPPA
jgi:hypothetical protein